MEFDFLGLAVASTVVVLMALHILYVPDSDADLGSLGSASATSAECKARIEAVYPLRAESQFVSLRAGTTHFYFRGPADGRRLVLVHGLTAPWAAMPEFVDGLVERGFRVLVYDIYGRGYSSSPGTATFKYSGRDYSSQLKNLLDHTGWTENVCVLGLSMGGGIVVTFADLLKDDDRRINGLVLLAPAGLVPALPPLANLVLLPWIGPIILHTLGPRILKSRGSNTMPGFKESPQVQHAAAVVGANVAFHPGFLRAFSETLRSGPLCNLHDAYRRVGKRFGKRVLCLWGSSDTVMNFKQLSPTFKELMPDAQLVVLPDCGHDFAVETPELLLPTIEKFLSA